VLLDEPEVAIEHAARAMRLSPLDPLTFLMQYSTALAHFHAGRYEEAGAWTEKAKRANPNFLPAIRLAAASHALTGSVAKARELMAHLREAEPSLTISGLGELDPFRRPKDFAKWVEGLREAGLPN
jgi:tetratricopeptide (TPR) repeat protein